MEITEKEEKDAWRQRVIGSMFDLYEDLMREELLTQKEARTIKLAWAYLYTTVEFPEVSRRCVARETALRVSRVNSTAAVPT